MNDERDVTRQDILAQTPYQSWEQFTSAMQRYRQDDEPEAK